ncbi:GGDEF domain-containing protein [Baaleninema sp.]|uniref:GGDEF domain-containing protein n=1 Tax=Baaleninema sp. TaxID=3101197 RepID=UPI003CFC4BF6
MTIDIATMSLVVSISSLLHAIVLVFLLLITKRCRGILVYTIGTILSAATFLFYLIRWFYPEFLILRLLGNIFIVAARVFYVLGIARFVERKEYRFLWLFLIGIQIPVQFYFTYIKPSFVTRNIWLLTVVIAAQIFASYYLFLSRECHFKKTAYFTAFVLILDSIVLLFRAFVLPFSGVQHLFHSSIINSSTFFSILISDHLRNAGFMMMVVQRLYSELENRANFDFLTNTLNRRAMNVFLNKEESRFFRYQTSFSLILLDIDRFKQINDTFGHDMGDIVLKNISGLLETHLRKGDYLSRWGGEEFLILLPKTSCDEAFLIAERLRQSVEKNPSSNGSIDHTISLGVGTFQQHGETIKALIVAVDKALYCAKTTGRNKTIVAIDPNALENTIQEKDKEEK